MFDTNFVTPPTTQNVDKDTYHPDTRIFVAIDFGTTHSGFAMAHIVDKEIWRFFNWKDQPCYYSKTLTSILYSDTLDEGLEVSWGYTARKLRKHDDMMYFERFKLYLDKKIAPTLEKLPDGYTTLDIISNYLAKLYNQLLSSLDAKYGKKFSLHNISWVLTVPAMWDEEAKQVMKDAAVKVGMVSEEEVNDKQKFVLVLEPEAAAMYCCEHSIQSGLQADEKFIIVDAGGGTVDLTAYRVNIDPESDIQSLCEICEGLGESCGSTFIDENFFKLLKSHCGGETIDYFRKNNPKDWFTLVSNWERLKREFVDVENESTYEIQLPYKLLKILPDEDMRDKIENDWDGNFKLSIYDMRSLYDPVIEQVIELIRKQIKFCELKLKPEEKIDKLLLVGGFASSEYLFIKVREEFHDIDVIRPGEPGNAVMDGAVYCGLNPRFVRSRCSRLTYGVRISGEWTDENPGGKEVQMYNEETGKIYATNLFHALAIKGQEITIDECVSEEFIPTAVDQQIGKLELFQTDVKDIKYMTSSMKKVGEIKIPIPSSAEDTDSPEEGNMRMRINIVQDVSSSMRGDKWDACKKGIKSICQNVEDCDEVGLITFNDDVSVLSDLQANSAGAILTATERLHCTGMTSLWDAIIKGHETLKESSLGDPYFRNVLIVMTDGMENLSRASFETVKKIIEDPEMPRFYFIFAYAGKTNQSLIDLCRSPRCSPYCKIIGVENSMDGITEAYMAIQEDIQLYRENGIRTFGKKVVSLKMTFGESAVKAEVFNESTGERRWCEFDFTCGQI